MKGMPLALFLVPLSLFVSVTACRSERPTALPEDEPRSVTISDTYYIRFELDGESYHVVPIDGDDLLRSASGGYLFSGPAYVRKEGEELWQCHPRGYQIPLGASIMVSSSRAPITIETLVESCW
jgi:hypothetical protein